MKETEIMIGDWVKVLPISHKVEPHYDRIESIRKEYTGQIYIEGGYHDREHKEVRDWFDWSVGLDDIAPIPLTTEILEKNGFKVDGYAILNLQDGKWLEYYFHEHRFSMYYEGIDEWQNHSQVRDIIHRSHPFYVHELQHCLRLCCLYKLADNLKIE